MTDVPRHYALLLRETIGWSRERLAKTSGVPVSAVYLLERLGWEDTPDDRRIFDALEAATTRCLETSAFISQLIAAGKVEQGRWIHFNDNREEQPKLIGSEQFDLSIGLQKSLDFTIPN